jgi:protein-S-isoprenylcysteine O-methyltransferase Ste14
MKRWLFFIYGVASYLVFFALFVYMAGFFGDMVVPRSVDTAIDGPVGTAVAVNLSLILLFGLQHSVMARPGFKKVWTRIVPEPIERSTYVLLSCLPLALLMWQWRSIGTVIWDVQQPALRAALWGLFALGWLAVPIVSLAIDHFDLFGLRQVWLFLRGREYTPLPFRVPLFYKQVRHPLYVGWAMFFWVTPTMTVGHLILAAGFTIYMGLAVIVEERDLIAHFGERYRQYRREVPAFVPRLKSRAVQSPVNTAVEGDTANV